MVNWAEIHEKLADKKSFLLFDETNYRQLWEKYNFNFQTTKEWAESLEKNFTVNDFAFCAWLRDEKKLTPQEVQQQGNLKDLKKEYNKSWADICRDFSSKGSYYYHNKTYQQIWEESNLTYQDAQEWTPLGFKLEDYYFINYLKQKGYNPTTIFQKKSYSQHQLDYLYQDQKDTKDIRICDRDLTGSLDLSDFVNLEKLDCRDNKIESIKFPQQVEKLTYLNIEDNNFPEQDLSFLSHLVSLKELRIGNRLIKKRAKDDICNRFIGSLEPLKGLTKLKTLDISNTDIDSGLEHLSANIKLICSADKKGVKVKSIKEQLVPHDGKFDVWKSAQSEKEIQLLKKQQSFFAEQETKINYLELRVQELTNLIKKQKEKIISAFLQIFPEKDLLQELITNYLELIKLKKNKKPFIKFRKQYEKLRDELEEKLGEELMEKVETILTDCEELVSWELELETKLNDKISLIENQKRVLQITDNGEEKKLIQKHEAIQQKEQRQLQEAIFKENYLKNQLSKVEELIGQQQAQTLQSTQFNPNK